MSDTDTPSAAVITIDEGTSNSLHLTIGAYLAGEAGLEDIVRLVLESAADGLIDMRSKPRTELDVRCPWCEAMPGEVCHVFGAPNLLYVPGEYHGLRTQRLKESLR